MHQLFSVCVQSRPDHGESLRICLQASCSHYPEGNDEADGAVHYDLRTFKGGNSFMAFHKK